MHDTLHFSGDAHADSGFWSPSTSVAKYVPAFSSCPAMSSVRVSALLNTFLSSFCDEDYAITKYIAEFINALSNLAYSVCISHFKFV
jgi:dihydroceramidase